MDGNGHGKAGGKDKDNIKAFVAMVSQVCAGLLEQVSKTFRHKAMTKCSACGIFSQA